MRSTALVASIAAAMFGASTARAEDAPATPPQTSSTVAAQPLERARVRYREGVEAYKEGRFRDAIDLFLGADQLAPSAALSFNIANAYDKLGDSASSLRWYRDYLRRAPDAPDRANVEGIVSGLEHALAEKGVQQLTVTSSPPDATLAIDGKEIGKTPATLELPPGAHTLSVSLEGRKTTSRDIELPVDHAIDVELDLAPEETNRGAGAGAEPAPVAKKPPSSPPAGPTIASIPMTTLGWIGVAAGGAALGGALAFEFLRESAESSAKSDRTQIGYADKLDTMNGRKTAARVLLGVGAGLTITGGALLWFGRAPSRAGDTAMAITCTPGTCISSLHGKF